MNASLEAAIDEAMREMDRQAVTADEDDETHSVSKQVKVLSC